MSGGWREALPHGMPDTGGPRGAGKTASAASRPGQRGERERIPGKNMKKSLFFRQARLASFLLVFLLLGLTAAGSAPVRAQEIGVRVEAAQDGGRRLLVISLTVPPGYHAYAHRAGDAGRPTTLRL